MHPLDEYQRGKSLQLTGPKTHNRSKNNKGKTGQAQWSPTLFLQIHHPVGFHPNPD